MSLPRTTRMPSDRAPDRKRTPHTSPALSRVEQELARPRHRTAAQDEEKAAEDVHNRARLARLVLREHGVDPDLVDRNLPLAGRAALQKAAREFARLADMLGLNRGAS